MEIEPIEITVDGERIRGNLYKPAGQAKRLALLFLHGWTGKPNDDAAKVLAENGFYAMTISMRGHNNSNGDIKQVSRQDSLKDATVAYDFLKAHIPPGVGIGVAGNSYGGYIAALLSAQRNITCLQLRVPANYPDEGFDKARWGKGNEDPHVALWRTKPLSYSENKALSAIYNFAGGIQLIEAECDEVVHTQTIQNYRNAVNHNKRLEYLCMKGWPHSLGDHKGRRHEYQSLLLKWVRLEEEQL